MTERCHYCERPARRNGLCNACYQLMWRRGMHAWPREWWPKERPVALTVRRRAVAYLRRVALTASELADAIGIGRPHAQALCRQLCQAGQLARVPNEAGGVARYRYRAT